MKNIAVYGAGSYGQEIACLIKKINSRAKAGDVIWNFIGFFDDAEVLWNKENSYGKILGGIDVLNVWDTPLSIVIAVANVLVVKHIVMNVENSLIDYPNIVDPDTSFLDVTTFTIGKGNIIGEGCRFSPNVRVDDFNIVVNDSVFGHDVSIGSFNVFFPEVRFSGHVTVGDYNLFGVRTTILQGFKIGSNVKISSGSFLMNNALDGYLYRGNPARKIKL